MKKEREKLVLLAEMLTPTQLLQLLEAPPLLLVAFLAECEIGHGFDPFFLTQTRSILGRRSSIAFSIEL